MDVKLRSQIRGLKTDIDNIDMVLMIWEQVLPKGFQYELGEAIGIAKSKVDTILDSDL